MAAAWAWHAADRAMFMHADAHYEPRAGRLALYEALHETRNASHLYHIQGFH